MSDRRASGDHGRFKSYKAEPERTVDLAADHPAVVEGRTLFPGTVKDVFESPRMLVSGENSPKTGGMITVGPWTDFPVYTLTLEERATCPRTCAQWRGCYGNSMNWARRNDVSDPDFIPALAAEVITVARQHPEGFAVRLHILGDFYSVQYVLAWAHLLAMLPNLHIWGYTARRTDLGSRKSRQIARAIELLTTHCWARFAVRTSHIEAGRDRTIVVMEDPKAPDVLVCPAQTSKTAACSSCGICWAPAARSKTVAWLKHGIKTRAAA